MARQYPNELHLGQNVLVYVDPTGHPVEALVTKIDNDEGTIHVNPIGYKVRWIAKPRAIATKNGLFLRFENKQFYFAPTRSLA
jgi:hypothetical protein